MVRLRPVLALGLAAASGLAARTARADVVLAPGAACGDEATLKARVQALSGGLEAGVDARVRVETRGDGFQAEVEVVRRADGTRGRRALDAHACADLVEAIALVVAMTARGPDPADDAPKPAPADDPPALASPPPLTAAPPRDDGPRRGRSVRPYLAPGAAFAVGVLPHPSVGVSAALGVELARLRLEARGAWLGSQWAATAQRADVGAEVGLLAAGGRACLALPLGARVVVAPCAGAGALVLRAEGRGVADARGRGAALFEAGPSAVATLALASFLRVRADVGASLVAGRRELAFENVGLAHRTTPLFGQASLGVEVSP